MRLKLCTNCGKQFEATKERALCPECAQKVKGSTAILDRVCRQCGAKFPGAPRAWYCPKCREERQRERNRQHKAAGAKRPLGSTDYCVNCGAEYIVQGSRQRYCKDCAAAATRAKVNHHKAEYAHKRREQNIAHKKRPAKVCVVCGKTFSGRAASVTCSDECAAKRRKQWQTAADAKRQKRQENKQ